MDINLLRSLVTVAMVAAFAGIVWWAYAPARKRRFERDALLPFAEDAGFEGGNARQETASRPFAEESDGARG